MEFDIANRSEVIDMSLCWNEGRSPEHGEALPEICLISEVPLILLNIDIKSRLGTTLVEIDRQKQTNGIYFNLSLIIDGEKVVSTQVLNMLAGHLGGFMKPPVQKIFPTEGSQSEFVAVVKEFLSLSEKIRASEVLMKSPLVTLKKGIGEHVYADGYLNVSEIIEWASSKNILTSTTLRNKSGMNHLITIRPKDEAIGQSETGNALMAENLNSNQIKKKFVHDETEKWRALAREKGYKIVEQFKTENAGRPPSQMYVAEQIAKEFENEGIVGRNVQKKLTAEYIKRIALKGVTGRPPNGYGAKKFKKTN